jgi:hypothetical protein
MTIILKKILNPPSQLTILNDSALCGVSYLVTSNF